MKTISNEQRELIDALIAERDLGGISASILEKDIHVSDTLRSLASLEHENVQLVFCGGTSLSKAHRIIERMSEDIDLKVVFDQNHGLSQSKMKSHLSAMKQKVFDCMTALGFENIEQESQARNANRYFGSGWRYQAVYTAATSLRPHLKLEFTTRTPCFPTSQQSLGYLAHQLADREATSFTMQCVAVEETLGEKVLSFLRRFAEHRAGANDGWDDALVRHIYDTWCIMSFDKTVVDRATEHFNDLVKFDRGEFARHVAFQADPAVCMRQALDAVGDDKQTIGEYESKLLPLIYGDARPTFSEAFGVFRAVAETLLATASIPSTPDQAIQADQAT